MRVLPRVSKVAAAALLWVAFGAFACAFAADSHYVGSETCRSCHDENYDSFAASAHQKLLDHKDPEKQGCEACHGAGADHVNSNGDESKIFRFQGAAANVVRTRCGTCHDDLSPKVHKPHSISCLACHSMHHYGEKKFLLVKTTPALCERCHH